MAAETPNVEDVIRALKQVAEDGDKFINNDLAARERLVESARELVLAAETPIESLLWNIWAIPTRTVAARIAVDLKIFETIVENGGCPKSNEDLAAVTGASPTLVKRISRACVSMGMLVEQGPNLYVPNSVTRLLATKEYAAGITFSFDITQLSFAKLPAYLRSTNFQTPEDASDGPFQYANNCPSAFSWLVQHPDVFEAFHGYVHALRQHRPSWTDMYPVQSRLVEGLKPDGDASVLVDVGGGTGQILQDFQNDVPQYTGRLVLQEIPEVVAAATEKGVGADGRIELQAHDFFNPQPIRGARAYFMRSVLHDWPDEQCRKILAQLKDAMELGYSKILISDCIVSDQQAAWQHISLDLYMMAQLSSRERTEREWRVLIESCGLDITGIYNKGNGNEGLIEVVRSV
ncbi:S-adenosyl-L-methionine-dependent methyltransferase [Annulohypoxylon bovei var. microspora]|nr:S-adenosyl-L-methionine-dependent methyltransferase [Annulohypoxylon bovei var. microspora]